jgi:HD-GYP domain-containing protein (c-di-GMP phosphodiesterase class II)
MQFNLTAGTILLLLFLLPLMGRTGIILVVLVIMGALLRFGGIVNRKTDELFINHAQLARSREELVGRNKELSILLDATTAIASQLDLDRILNILSERIGNAVDCTFVKILLKSDDGKRAVVKAAHTAQVLEWDPAQGSTFELEPGSPMLSALCERTSITLNAEQIKQLCSNADVMRCMLGNLEQMQSLLIMPITMQGECHGLVVLGERRSRERSPFTQEKSGLALALVQHAGIAIENARHYWSLQRANLETIIGLGEALETRDVYTQGHSERAVEYARTIAQELKLTKDQADRLQFATILHDIGKIGIPDNILNKPSQLTDEEYALMKTHPAKGANIVSKIRFLQQISVLIRHHHERWDGKGYPDGLAGDNIPIESRIVAVLDSFDAMTSDRVYRPAPGWNYAISELRRCSGTQFDPSVVGAFLKILGVQREAPAQRPD